MRALVIASLCLLLAVPTVSLLAAPAGARQTAHRGECRKLTKQIGRYVGDLEMAKERDNQLWEHENLRQIDRLAGRRARLCPQYAQDDSALLRRIGNFLGTAAVLGLKYLTFGLI